MARIIEIDLKRIMEQERIDFQAARVSYWNQLLAQAEALPERASNGGGCRGYPLSVWYGHDTYAFVVDYNEDGSADRVARVGTGHLWHNPT